MRTIKMAGAVLAALLLAVSCGEAPDVVQGVVLKYDADSKVLVLKDERPPHDEMELSLAGAEMGAEPQVDDVVRAAFYRREGRFVASRLMNLTRQKELR